MVPRIFQNGNAVDGITAAANAAQVGNIYFRQGRLSKIVFRYVDGSGAPADILSVLGDITCFKNKKAFRTHNAAQLDFLNQLNGTIYARQQVGAGATMVQFLTLWFFEPWRQDVSDKESQCLIVDPSQGFDRDGLWVQVKLLLGIPATGQLTYTMYYDNLIPQTTTQQTCKLVYRDNLNVQGLSTDMKSLPQTGKLETLSFSNPSGGGSGTIKSVQAKVNNFTWLDNIPLEDMISHSKAAGVNHPALAQAAGAFQYVWTVDDVDPIQSALSLAGSVNPVVTLYYTAGSNGSVVAMSEFQDIIPN